jgi:hypothetical protein
MNDAYAVKVLTERRQALQTYVKMCVLRSRYLDEVKWHRMQAAALSCAIRALTGKRPTRRKTPKFVARA